MGKDVTDAAHGSEPAWHAATSSPTNKNRSETESDKLIVKHVRFSSKVLCVIKEIPCFRPC
jgi:hypothetical protein